MAVHNSLNLVSLNCVLAKATKSNLPKTLVFLKPQDFRSLPLLQIVPNISVSPHEGQKFDLTVKVYCHKPLKHVIGLGNSSSLITLSTVFGTLSLIFLPLLLLLLLLLLWDYITICNCSGIIFWSSNNSNFIQISTTCRRILAVCGRKVFYKSVICVTTPLSVSRFNPFRVATRTPILRGETVTFILYLFSFFCINSVLV